MHMYLRALLLLACGVSGAHAQCLVELARFDYSGALVNYTVPAGFPQQLWVEAAGAQGGYNGSSSTSSGLGARMAGGFVLPAGTALKMLVGEQPSANAGNGGGGGTFMTLADNTPLLVAGGGGGSSQGDDSANKHGQSGTTGGTGAGGGGAGGSAGSGGGVGASGFQSGAGGGLLGNGADGWTSGTGGSAFVNGGAGAPTNNLARGGFGGGGSGSSYVVGGGGGGYSGGGSGGNATAGVGGGGGSYNSGAAPVNVGGAQSGNGYLRLCASAGVAVAPATVTTTEAGGTASLSVVLQYAPTQDVQVALTSSDTTEGTVLPATLTFTPANWNVAQTATVTGVDDPMVDGDIAYQIQFVVSSSDTAYNGLVVAPVGASNTDNDVAGVGFGLPVGGLVTTESGGTTSFTVVLSTQPAADVTITATSSNTAEGTVSPAALTFTAVNWNVAQTVTVTGVNDALPDGDVAYAIDFAASSADPLYSGIALASLSAVNRDTYVAVIRPVPTLDRLMLVPLGLMLFGIAWLRRRASSKAG